MSKLDEPRERILRLFQMEQREGRTGAALFHEGIRPAEVPLEPGDRVYGVYKDRYFFSPGAFFQVGLGGGIEGFHWRDVVSCSSRHGDGDKYAEVLLVDGRTVRVRVGDMAVGWSGRISQLFHQLVEKLGARAWLGPKLLGVAEFFDHAQDPYTYLPNLEPHPTLSEARADVEKLSSTPGVRGVWLAQVEPDGKEPVVDGLVVVGDISAKMLSSITLPLGAAGVFEAEEPLRRHVLGADETTSVWRVVWD